jgi:hypothetical protein
MSAALITLPAISAESVPIPDFTGPWFRNMFNFEAPDMGPGPIVNLKRLGPDAGFSVADGDPIPLVGDYNNPILTPEAAAVVKKNAEYSESGHDVPDPSNQCGTYSPPYLFSIALGMQMLQGKEEIVILYLQDSQVRHVRLDSSHPLDPKPTPMGDAIAHYEGDTLVIDTIGVKIQPYTVADRFGTPQSEAMHVIERYRLIDAKEAQAAMDRHAKVVGTVGPMFPDPNSGKALRVELKIEDPNVFTAPWTANVTYRRLPFPLADFTNICAENNVDMLHQGDLKHVPTANIPDF